MRKLARCLVLCGIVVVPFLAKAPVFAAIHTICSNGGVCSGTCTGCRSSSDCPRFNGGQTCLCSGICPH
jgi:hypothetical protein